MVNRVDKLLIFGDEYGVSEVLGKLPVKNLTAIIGASIRPQGHAYLGELARAYGVPFIVQPRASDRVERAEFYRRIESLRPDGLICNSYALLIPPDILELVSGYAFNVHFSLLPINRGPNPIQWALIRGDSVTGATLHVMTAGFDEGPIVDQQEVLILQSDTWVSLMERAKEASTEILQRTLPKLLAGSWTARPQDQSKARINFRIPKTSFELDLPSMSDLQVFNLIRAQVAPLAGAYLIEGANTLRFRDYLTLEQVRDLRSKHNCFIS